jgi:hypothetical protein
MILLRRNAVYTNKYLKKFNLQQQQHKLQQPKLQQLECQRRPQIYIVELTLCRTHGLGNAGLFRQPPPQSFLHKQLGLAINSL